ncbi:MAG: helix-turn-helix domain-containing protein [Planctomycetota bacterium]
MKRSKGVYRVSRRDQLAVLVSPIRARLVDLLSRHGACSVAKLSNFMLLRPESVRYHVKELQRVDLVRDLGQRPGSYRSAAVFELVAPRLSIDLTQRSRTYPSVYLKTARSILRLTARDIRRCLDRGEGVFTGADRDLLACRFNMRLEPRQLARLNRELERLCSMLEVWDRQEHGAPCALTLVMVPPLTSRRWRSRTSVGRSVGHT